MQIQRRRKLKYHDCPTSNFYKFMMFMSIGFSCFQDCHTVSHSTPIRDKSQDWSLLNGQETDFGTVLTFTRMLDTCDDDDVIVTVSTDMVCAALCL